MNVKLSEEQKIKIVNSDDIFEIMQKILLRENQIDIEKEHFWIIGLSQSNKILFIELVSMGSVKATQVEPMNVYRVAVLKGAVSVILIHNHPSGELKPSKADKDITDRLFQVGKILAIEVIDHIIITTKSFFSFTDTGLLSEIEESIKWVPNFALEQKIRKDEAKLRKEVVKTEKEKAINKRNLEIAKEMKRKGYAIKEIEELTGLSEKEIEKIKKRV
jgi:DNA repair protein RadC